MSQTPASPPLRVAVVTGQHAYDVPAFHALFRTLEGVDAYTQGLDDLAADAGGALATYDAMVFYNMHRRPPEGREAEVLSRLGETGQGVVVLHHGLLAFPGWDVWDRVVGIPDRSLGSYHHDEIVPLHVERPEHPIVAGLADWAIRDETYLMAAASEGSDVLVTTDHPRSVPTIAWTRTFGRARVLCFACGHDAAAYEDAGFRRVLGRGIRWVAGRL